MMAGAIEKKNDCSKSNKIMSKGLSKKKKKKV